MSIVTAEAASLNINAYLSRRHLSKLICIFRWLHGLTIVVSSKTYSRWLSGMNCDNHMWFHVQRCAFSFLVMNKLACWTCCSEYQDLNYNTWETNSRPVKKKEILFYVLRMNQLRGLIKINILPNFIDESFCSNFSWASTPPLKPVLPTMRVCAKRSRYGHYTSFLKISFWFARCPKFVVFFILKGVPRLHDEVWGEVRSL